MLDELEKIQEETTAVNNEDQDLQTSKEQQAEEKNKQQKQFVNAVKDVSSASEAEQSGSEVRAKKQQQTNNSTIKDKVESAKKQVQFYKGVKVDSDTDDVGYQSANLKNKANQNDQKVYDPERRSSSESNNSADEAFNSQRKQIKKQVI